MIISSSSCSHITEVVKDGVFHKFAGKLSLEKLKQVLYLSALISGVHSDMFVFKKPQKHGIVVSCFQISSKIKTFLLLQDCVTTFIVRLLQTPAYI